jgi:CheY-like chemotaxis protein
MDIVMSEMDRYQTMQVIRTKTNLRRLPIIALTAKAMKGDRLEAGAFHYLAIPVNTDQLLSALRMWLHRCKGLRPDDPSAGQHPARRRPAREAGELRGDPR